MALEREQQILAVDAVAVIDHPDQLTAPSLELDLDPRGTSVDRVLDQLLDDRTRPLDDLTRGDLIGQRRRQHGDPSACGAHTLPLAVVDYAVAAAGLGRVEAPVCGLDQIVGVGHRAVEIRDPN